MDILVITPVKDSLETTRKTIEAVSNAEGSFKYVIFNDFSGIETRNFLENNKETLHFQLINLEEITQTPSPNYKITLQKAQEMALSLNVPLLIIESDVIIKKNTISQLLDISSQLKNPGLVGAITVDSSGNYNFPYSQVKPDKKPWNKTNRSLSFCCTLICREFLAKYDFRSLSNKKDWYDISISRQSRETGFNNYLVKKTEVLHLPHSSRPWKQLKYSNPLKYYFYKLIQHRDKI
jgi:hypothetical protein